MLYTVETYLLLFFIYSIGGWLMEVIGKLIEKRKFVNRGFLIGPYCPIYGHGAILITILLQKYIDDPIALFIMGVVVCSILEYLTSYFMEKIFHARWWDYSRYKFNINGRICLLYSVFWGLLGILWIKKLYPRIASVILYIPNKFGKITVWILFVFILFNSLVSGLAVYRWAERINNKEPSNKIEVLLDKRFPDERLEKIYANLEFRILSGNPR